MAYEESALFDIIGIKAFTIESYFPFDCRVMPWSNDRIRTGYYAAVGQ